MKVVRLFLTHFLINALVISHAEAWTQSKFLDCIVQDIKKLSADGKLSTPTRAKSDAESLGMMIDLDELVVVRPKLGSTSRMIEIQHGDAKNDTVITSDYNKNKEYNHFIRIRDWESNYGKQEITFFEVGMDEIITGICKGR